MAGLRTHSALVCSKGCVRGNNEDNFYFQGDYMHLREVDEGAHILQKYESNKQLYAIMDGMGGEAQGERAAYLAVKLLSQMAPDILAGKTADKIDQFARKATDAVYKDSLKANPGHQGTTMAMLALIGKTAYVANVGDSRVYLLRGGRLRMLSQDHTTVYKMRLAGALTSEQARKHPRGNVISQYIGMDPASLPKDYVYQNSISLCKDDRLMLCSDGASDLIPEDQMEDILSHEVTADAAACQIVETALMLGGKDNTTCIVVDVTDSKLPEARRETKNDEDDMTTQ